MAQEEKLVGDPRIVLAGVAVSFALPRLLAGGRVFNAGDVARWTGRPKEEAIAGMREIWDPSTMVAIIGNREDGNYMARRRNWFVPLSPFNNIQESYGRANENDAMRAVSEDDFDTSWFAMASRGWVIVSLTKGYLPTKEEQEYRYRNVPRVTIYTPS